MGLRINKSFKIAPGVCIWLGTKSSSLSVGGKAVRVTLNSRGRRTTTVHLAPGVSYSTSKGQGRTRVALSWRCRASERARRRPYPTGAPHQRRAGREGAHVEDVRHNDLASKAHRLLRCAGSPVRRVLGSRRGCPTAEGQQRRRVTRTHTRCRSSILTWGRSLATSSHAL
ncbi:DUF4236 domain-containing protein [Streptomyces sp. CB02959]|uniref:DUF4236 domain-containing protein n=1 Tax=Streptomyces sp. CB02959 TaxID=2020330 RepID=UPI0015E0E544|nr:DUF4236 domain-containing protein [Streptomyces sp. CB02959]